jgi:hypothetical protein
MKEKNTKQKVSKESSLNTNFFVVISFVALSSLILIVVFMSNLDGIANYDTSLENSGLSSLNVNDVDIHQPGIEKSVTLEQDGDYVYDQAEYSELTFINLGQRLTTEFDYLLESSKKTSGKFIKATILVTNESAVNKTVDFSNIELVDSEGRKFTYVTGNHCNNQFLFRGPHRVELKSYIPCQLEVLFEVAPDSEPVSVKMLVQDM